MKTMLKTIVAGSAPAFLVTCALGAGVGGADTRTISGFRNAAPTPLDAPGTQPSTQPATQPAPAPPPVRRGGVGGLAGRRG
jgi:hypothetical protein